MRAGTPTISIYPFIRMQSLRVLVVLREECLSFIPSVIRQHDTSFAHPHLLALFTWHRTGRSLAEIAELQDKAYRNNQTMLLQQIAIEKTVRHIIIFIATKFIEYSNTKLT